MNDIKKKIANIESMLKEILQKMADKPELEQNLPGPSQTPNASLDLSITDEDLESILSGFCAPSPPAPFQPAKLVSPSMPGPSLSQPPFFHQT